MCGSVSTCRWTQFWDSRYGSSRPRFFLPLEIFPPLDLCNGLLSASSFPLLSGVEREYHLAREMVARDEFVSNETNRVDYSIFFSKGRLDLIRLKEQKKQLILYMHQYRSKYEKYPTVVIVHHDLKQAREITLYIINILHILSSNIVTCPFSLLNSFRLLNYSIILR